MLVRNKELFRLGIPIAPSVGTMGFPCGVCVCVCLGACEVTWENEVSGVWGLSDDICF